MIALPKKKVVKSGSRGVWLDHAQAPAKSFTGLAIRGFELVHLRIVLAGESAFWCFAIEVGTWAVVERGVQIDPNLGVGIAFVFRRLGRFGQSQTDEESVEH